MFIKVSGRLLRSPRWLPLWTFHLAVTGPLTLRPDARLPKSIALALHHACAPLRNIALWWIVFFHIQPVRNTHQGADSGCCMCWGTAGKHGLKDSLRWHWRTVGGGWRNPFLAHMGEQPMAFPVSHSPCPVVPVTQDHPISTPPMKGCDWLQAGAHTSALFLFNLLVQRWLECPFLQRRAKVL